MILALLLLAGPVGLLAEGRPLHDWGGRPPALVAPAVAPRSTSAAVREIHGALVDGELILRFTFDRPVREALHLADGRPVSGRLRVALYIDSDDDRRTGVDLGSRDLRTGADLRLEIGVVSLGEDPEEGLKASALMVAALQKVSRELALETLWRADDEAQPGAVSWRGEWAEVRVPTGGRIMSRARLILCQDGQAVVGRLTP